MKNKLKPFADVCRKYPTLMACIFLSLALGLIFYVRSGTLDDRQIVLEDKSKLLKKLTTTAKNAIDLEKHTNALIEINKAIDAAALREGELAINQQIFLRLESETGTKIELRPQGVSQAAAGSPYVFMNFALTVSGDYRKIITFLKRLECGPTLSRLTSVSLSGSESEPQSVSLSVDLLGVKR